MITIHVNSTVAISFSPFSRRTPATVTFIYSPTWLLLLTRRSSYSCKIARASIGWQTRDERLTSVSKSLRRRKTFPPRCGAAVCRRRISVVKVFRMFCESLPSRSAWARRKPWVFGFYDSRPSISARSVGFAISFFYVIRASDNRDKMENGKKNLFHSFETIDILEQSS